MNQKILLFRGSKNNLPTLSISELGFTTDTNEIFVGTATGNKRIYPVDEIYSIPIGVPFPIWYEDDLLVVNNKSKLIKLSKNLISTGLYNEGKLSNQSVIVTNETAFYSAVISNSSSRLNNKTVVLINSTENITNTTTNEPTFLGASESALNSFTNQFQGFNILLISNSLSDAYSYPGYGGRLTNNACPTSRCSSLFSNPAVGNFINNYFDGDPRTGKTTRPDTTTAVYYMRIL